MPTPDRSFVDGLFWRMIALGMTVAVLVAALYVWQFGYSIALGTLLGAVSLRVSVVAISRLFRGAIAGNSWSIGWAIVLAMKFLGLAIATWICVMILKVHVLAFVIGYKMIFPALIWQVKIQPDLDGSGDETDDIESP